jgi:hypothetical protein
MGFAASAAPATSAATIADNGSTVTPRAARAREGIP